MIVNQPKKVNKAKMITWLGQGDLTIVFNSERKNFQAFGKESIVSEARISNQQFDQARPQWVHGQI